MSNLDQCSYNKHQNLHYPDYPHLFLKAPKGQTEYHLVGPNGLLIEIKDNDDQ